VSGMRLQYVLVLVVWVLVLAALFLLQSYFSPIL
jgi:hypothetical protein